MFRVFMLSADVLRQSMGGLGEHVKEISLSMTRQREDICIEVITPTFGEEYLFADRIAQRYALCLNRARHSLRKSYLDVLRHQSEIIARALKLPRPDIVHAHDWSTFDAGRILAQHFEVPLVTSIHLSIEDMMIPDAQENLPSLLEHIQDMQNMALIEADAVCHVSHYYQQKFDAHLRQSSFLVGNGINPDPWKVHHERWIFPGERPKKLVYIGRLAYMKNVDTLLQATLPDDVDLCIIGGSQGSDPDVYRQAVRAAEERSNVHMLGALYGDDKVRAMKSATFGIFPSRHEPFGLVGLEWMLAKVPFGASYVDGMKSYLNNEALFCGTSKTSIEACISDLCAMSADKRKAHTEAGFQKALNFSWDAVASKTLEAYSVAHGNFTDRLDSCMELPFRQWQSNPRQPS